MVTPLEFAFKEAIQPENLRQAIDYIEEIKWEGDLLYVRSKAFGFEAKMWVRFRMTLNRTIHFEIVRGTLTGAEGDLSFEDVHFEGIGHRTEVGISGHYDFVHFPLPKMFAEFGIEVILQRAAIKMRDFLENSYKNRPAGTSHGKEG